MKRPPNRLTYVALVFVGQLVAFITGLVVVRTTGRSEYAAYSATMTAVGAVILVAASGTGSLLTARLAAGDSSFTARGSALRGAFAVRRIVVIPIFCLLGAVLAYVLVNLGLSPLLVAASIVALGILTSSTLYRSLLTADLQIQRRFVPIAASDTSGNVVRLVLVVGAAAAFNSVGGTVPLSFILIFAVIASFTQTWVAGRSSPFHPLSGGGERSGEADYRRAIRQTLPWTALSITGDQFVNVLLARAGNAIAIAEIGALTRYALAFNLVNSLIGSIVLARVALVQGGRRDLTSTLLRVIAGGGAICGVFVGGLWVFRDLLLGLLGPSYSHLETPFLILAVASAFQFFNVYVLGLVVHARGWTRGNWIYGPGLLIWIAWAVALASPTSTTQAAIVVLALQIPALASQLFRIALGLRATPLEQPKADSRG